MKDGFILVSDCCGAEALYRVSKKYGFGLWDFCPACLEIGFEWLEVTEDFDSEKYLEALENDNENQLNQIQHGGE